MKTILCMAVAIMLVAFSCGDNTTNWAKSKDLGTLVARGHNAQGREFGVWDDNKEVIWVGWIKSKDKPDYTLYAEPSRGGKFLEIIVKDCDGDGADDLIVTAESPDAYSRGIILNGDLLPGSEAESGFSMERHPRATGGFEQFSDIDTRCKELAENLKKLKKYTCEKTRKEDLHKLPKRCER